MIIEIASQILIRYFSGFVTVYASEMSPASNITSGKDLKPLMLPNVRIFVKQNYQYNLFKASEECL